MWARGRCFHSFSSTIHNLSYPVLCVPPACFLFCEPLPSFSVPIAPLATPLHTVQNVVPSPPLCPMSQSCDMNYEPYFYSCTSDSQQSTLCSFCSLLYSHLSLLFSFPLRLSLLLASALCSRVIILSHPSKLSSLCPQCLVSVRRASFPAQMAVALPGGGSAMGTTTALMVQTRYRSSISFLIYILLWNLTHQGH